MIAAAVRAQPVLAVGRAQSLLLEETPGSHAGRDAAASAALCAATGREDIRISRRPSGRPRLLPPYPELGVSMAARGGWLAVGFADRGRVGVDVELADERIEATNLARDHFARGESEAISRLGGRDARDLFLRFWVAKEALLKLTGRGVFDGMSSPDLSSATGVLLRDGVSARAELRGASAAQVAVSALVIGSVRAYCALAVADD